MTHCSPVNDRPCRRHCTLDGRCILCGDLEVQRYAIHKHGGMQHAHHLDWRDVARVTADLEVAHDHRPLTPAVHR